MLITKEIKWHMGHRLKNHKSACRGNHGHTYFCEVGLEADHVVQTIGSSDEGMVMDFGDIKTILIEEVYKALDHGTMLQRGDTLIPAMEEDEATKLVIVDFPPTAENIAKWVWGRIGHIIDDVYKTGLKLKFVKIFETPTSSATYLGD